MKRAILLCAALSLSVAVHAEDEEPGPGETREVEVIRGPRGHGGGGPAGEMGGDEDLERGPMGERGGARGMRRMMMPKEHMRGGGFGREMDPAMKERMEKLRAAEESLREVKIKLRSAKDSEKAALKKEARAALGEVFDAKLAVEQAMVDKMAEHLAEKKAKLAKRKAAREKLIDEKLDQLSGDSPSWDD